MDSVHLFKDITVYLKRKKGETIYLVSIFKISVFRSSHHGDEGRRRGRGVAEYCWFWTFMLFNK